ncbi:G-protein-signaling modulator 1 [Camelus ferus]|nr:G-protein-signaling modulator 1 [Camelus ferus]
MCCYFLGQKPEQEETVFHPCLEGGFSRSVITHHFIFSFPLVFLFNSDRVITSPFIVYFKQATSSYLFNFRGCDVCFINYIVLSRDAGFQDTCHADPSLAALPGNWKAASSALSSLGHVYTAIGDYPNALASHKQCVLLAKQSKDELSEARELGNMGAVYIAMGDFENAVQCHEQHLKIAKDLGNKREEARAYSNLGSAYHYRRNFDKAMSYHNYVLELAQELMEKAIEMRAYAGLGHAARCMQDLERAKQYHEQQLGIAEDLKDRAAEGRASSNLGKDRIACKFQGQCHGDS